MDIPWGSQGCHGYGDSHTHGNGNGDRNSTPTATLVDTEISLFFETKETVIKSH